MAYYLAVPTTTVLTTNPTMRPTSRTFSVSTTFAPKVSPESAPGHASHLATSAILGIVFTLLVFLGADALWLAYRIKANRKRKLVGGRMFTVL